MNRARKSPGEISRDRHQIEEDTETRELEDCIRRSREWIDRLDKFLNKEPGIGRNQP